MFNKNEQIAVEAQKAIDATLDLVTTSIQGVEKLTQIQLETSRQILEETSKAIKELSGVSDAKEMFARVNAIAVQTVEKNLASARNAYDIVSDVQAKINQVAEERIQSLQQAALTSVDGLTQLNPNGSNFASDTLKTWINSANQAVSAMHKAAAQVTEFTHSNLNAASTVTTNSIKKSQKK